MSAPYMEIELQPAPFGAPPPPQRELARTPSPTPSESRALDAATRKRPRPRDLLTRGTVGASPSTRGAPRSLTSLLEACWSSWPSWSRSLSSSRSTSGRSRTTWGPSRTGCAGACALAGGVRRAADGAVGHPAGGSSSSPF
jgi:hypothetical protein